ncbi:hypothetical protein HK405_007086 [Cladochytrium tenue]|nr:hypothetical protein HK405_007086 [Cladochytrium tenue]
MRPVFGPDGEGLVRAVEVALAALREEAAAAARARERPNANIGGDDAGEDTAGGEGGDDAGRCAQTAATMVPNWGGGRAVTVEDVLEAIGDADELAVAGTTGGGSAGSAAARVRLRVLQAVVAELGRRVDAVARAAVSEVGGRVAAAEHARAAAERIAAAAASGAESARERARAAEAALANCEKAVPVPDDGCEGCRRRIGAGGGSVEVVLSGNDGIYGSGRGSSAPAQPGRDNGIGQGGVRTSESQITRGEILRSAGMLAAKKLFEAPTAAGEVLRGQIERRLLERSKSPRRGTRFPPPVSRPVTAPEAGTVWPEAVAPRSALTSRDARSEVERQARALLGCRTASEYVQRLHGQAESLARELALRVDAVAEERRARGALEARVRAVERVTAEDVASRTGSRGRAAAAVPVSFEDEELGRRREVLGVVLGAGGRVGMSGARGGYAVGMVSTGVAAATVRQVQEQPRAHALVHRTLSSAGSSSGVVSGLHFGTVRRQTVTGRRESIQF